jgi:hypothetical protein
MAECSCNSCNGYKWENNRLRRIQDVSLKDKQQKLKVKEQIELLTIRKKKVTLNLEII